MAFYLVRARPHPELLEELAAKLEEHAFLAMRPFGPSLTRALWDARWQDDGLAAWEELDFCSPPLKEERAAVLDRYFSGIEVEAVEKEGEAWGRLADLPRVFPGLWP